MTDTRLCLAITLLLAGCGLEPSGKEKDKSNSEATQQTDSGKKEADDSNSNDTPSGSNPIAGLSGWTTKDQIAASLARGNYKSWPAEAAVHSSTGPHGKVRTFVNQTLKSSLDQENATHPAGSIAVKELYKADGTTLNGYAVEVKTKSGSGADTWLWYEDFNNTAGTDFFGQGLGVCTGCHSQGTDYVTTTL